MGSVWFDRAGQPITLAEAERLLADPDYRVVGKTQVGDDEVSTVWLGCNHNWFGTGPPIIFETLVFPDCELMERYTTEDDARTGHDLMVARLRAGIPPDYVPDGL